MPTLTCYSLVFNRRTRISTICMTSLVLLLLFQPVLSAQSLSVAPTRKASITELPTDPEFQPLPGTYYYDVYLKKMRVGKATITISRNEELYTIRVAAKTRKMISSLYKVQYRGEVEMHPNPLKPLTAEIEERSGTNKTEISIHFPEQNRVAAVEVKTKGDKEPTSTEREFESDTFVLDPFSTIFLIRSLDWQVGMAEVFDIFSGKKQYELQLLCRDVTTLKIAGTQREAWEIIPQTTTLTEPREVKVANYSIYLSKDAQKEVLKIKGEPKIGRVVARMRKFEELPDH